MSAILLMTVWNSKEFCPHFINGVLAYCINEVSEIWINLYIDLCVLTDIIGHETELHEVFCRSYFTDNEGFSIFISSKTKQKKVNEKCYTKISLIDSLYLIFALKTFAS